MSSPTKNVVETSSSISPYASQTLTKPITAAR
jgi:hypothetical protein